MTIQTDKTTSGMLALAHLHLAQGYPAKAAECIRSIKSIAHSAGTVATLVALYDEAQDATSSQEVLAEALSFHSSSNPSSEEALRIRV